MTESRSQPVDVEAVVSSALWAAWGDALGFMTELAKTRRIVAARTGEQTVSTTIAWERRVGGRFGPTIPLPAGTWSDDTQLRLATSRCIRTTGRFDVEAFSKIELPVFLAYQLGAGRGTVAAANNLSRRATRWNANFFTGASTYVDGGGNGAAMRIQPHVWASARSHPSAFLGDVVVNTVCTHGHPRALVGAALHAMALSAALRRGLVPGPDRWPGMIEFLTESLISIIDDIEPLRDRWRPAWEEATGTTVADTVASAIDETRTMLAAVSAISPSEDGYRQVLERTGGNVAATRGAGTVTAVCSLWLAAAYHDDPQTAIRVAANVLESDTDTMASMAGALLGAARRDRPAGPVHDAELIEQDARRLHAISAGASVDNFPHPDPLKWVAPRSQLDCIGLRNGHLELAGLGALTPTSDALATSARDDAAWYWYRTDAGQSIIARQRDAPRELSDDSKPVSRAPPTAPRASQLVLGTDPAAPNSAAATESPPTATTVSAITVDNALAEISTSDFGDADIGRVFKRVVFSSSAPLTDAVALAAALVRDLSPPPADD